MASIYLVRGHHSFCGKPADALRRHHCREDRTRANMDRDSPAGYRHLFARTLQRCQLCFILRSSRYRGGQRRRRVHAQHADDRVPRLDWRFNAGFHKSAPGPCLVRWNFNTDAWSRRLRSGLRSSVRRNCLDRHIQFRIIGIYLVAMKRCFRMRKDVLRNSSKSSKKPSMKRLRKGRLTDGSQFTSN